jgi:hypothetical protein
MVPGPFSSDAGQIGRYDEGEVSMPHIKRRIVSLLKDDHLEASEKIATLRQLEMDSHAKERSANEGFMPVDGDDGEDLKAIEQALRKLGQQPIAAGAGLSP